MPRLNNVSVVLFAFVLGLAVAIPTYLTLKAKQYPLARVVTVQPRKAIEPVIRRGATKDGYLIENPLAYDVSVTLDCGTSWERIVVEVKAKNWELVEVVNKGGQVINDCFIWEWTGRRSKR